MVAPLLIAALLLFSPIAVDVTAGESINADQPTLHAIEKIGEILSFRSKVSRAHERLAELDIVKKPEGIARTAAELDEVAEALPPAEKAQALVKRDEVLKRVLASAPDSAKPGLQRALNAPRGPYAG